MRKNTFYSSNLLLLSSDGRMGSELLLGGSMDAVRFLKNHKINAITIARSSKALATESR